VLVPVPVVVTPPGFRVSVQVPDEGNPEITTLPVAIAQVGCVMVPGIGTAGIGCSLITTFTEDAEVQPVALDTMKE
jgi:hypothetical protein